MNLLTSLSSKLQSRANKVRWAARGGGAGGRRGGAAAAPRRTKNRQILLRRVWPSINDFQSNKSLRLLRTAS